MNLVSSRRGTALATACLLALAAAWPIQHARHHSHTTSVRPTGGSVVRHADTFGGAGGAYASEADPNPNSGLPGCDDGTYRFIDDRLTWFGRRWNSTMNWWWSGRYPASMTASEFIDRVKTQFANELDLKNQSTGPCPLADHIDATAVYKGVKSGIVDIDSSGVCLGKDGYSGIDTGNLPSNLVAITCNYENANGYTIESDVRLNTADFTWRRDSPDCDPTKREVILKNVVGHELGHSFGLDDIYDDQHKHLTMYGYIHW